METENDERDRPSLAAEFARRLAMIRASNSAGLGFDLIGAFYPWINDEGDKIVETLTLGEFTAANADTFELGVTAIAEARKAISELRAELAKTKKELHDRNEEYELICEDLKKERTKT